ncbi:hypothetical protein CSA37_13000 [Candidatus Fermentibacteria bacterium]|nr:MAG: hypothetical protein CSA37_13000 [Candidatus Fermentibacteria bacterium]
MVDLNGVERPGWPLEHSSNIVTGITVVDLDEDGSPEIAYGTGDGQVHLRDINGNSVGSYPVDLGSRLQYQPTIAELGGSSGNGLICTTNNSRIELLNRSGESLPGWPQQLPVPSGTIPVSGDIDGDASTDIVVATQDGRVHVFNIMGRELEGWPFRLGARPVTGVPALGNLIDEGNSLQIAIASVDSLVYLLNSNGRMAGAWRWPDKVNARSWQPLICSTDQGKAVIAVTQSGEINAWNAEGRLLNGFPVETGSGCIAPPVVADMDGDGATELITVSPSGTVQATQLSVNSAGSEIWPMAMRDQFNSGAFFRGDLPAVTVEQITGEFQGSVTLGYSLTDHTLSDLTVSYSTDAGYSWIPTENYTLTPNSLTWRSEEDLPYADIGTCMLKITPFTGSQTGESGTSGLFHIDNNQPPVMMISSLTPISDGTISLSYTLEDTEGDDISIEGVYSYDDGVTWNLLDLFGNVTDIEGFQYGDSLFLTPPSEAAENTLFRIRASDADPGPWTGFDGLEVDSADRPSLQIVAPTTEVSGDVEFSIRFTQGIASLEMLPCQYSTDLGEHWHDATMRDTVSADSTGAELTFIWDSSTDVPQLDSKTVQLRALPVPGSYGVPVPSSVFHLDNNSSPRCRIEYPERYDLFRGLVPVTFTVADTEWDTITLDLQYRLYNRDDTWHSAKGIINNRIIDPSRYSTILDWNSSVDLPDVSGMELELRLLAADKDSIWSETVGPIALANSDIPQVISATVSSLNSVSKIMEVAFELMDPRKRQLTLSADYSADDGLSWNRASVSVTPAVLSNGSYSGFLQWNYGNDSLAGKEVTLRLTPLYGNNEPGRTRIIRQTFQ